MDWELSKNIATNLFTFEKNRYRSFSVKRVFLVLILVPIFIMLIVWNRLFMALDHLLFPKFKNQSISNAVFIIAMPRSATTFLYHSLVNSNQFSYFKLWEILFAPAICQKYFFIGMKTLDQRLGSPVRSFVLYLENLISGEFKKIHLLGLDLPEEDELLLLWNMSSAYLHFLVPLNSVFNHYFYFDEQMPVQKKLIF